LYFPASQCQGHPLGRPGRATPRTMRSVRASMVFFHLMPVDGQSTASWGRGHTDSIDSVCFSPDGTKIVSGTLYSSGVGSNLISPLHPRLHPARLRCCQLAYTLPLHPIQNYSYTVLLSSPPQHPAHDDNPPTPRASWAPHTHTHTNTHTHTHTHTHTTHTHTHTHTPHTPHTHTHYRYGN